MYKFELEWKTCNTNPEDHSFQYATGLHGFSLIARVDGSWTLSTTYCGETFILTGEVKESNDLLEAAKQQVKDEYTVRVAGLALAYQGMRPSPKPNDLFIIRKLPAYEWQQPGNPLLGDQLIEEDEK